MTLRQFLVIHRSEIQPLDVLHKRGDSEEEQREEIKKRNEANHNVTFDIYTSINNCVKQNKTRIAYYKALATNVPEKLWVTYFEADPLAQVSIKGTSAS